MKKVILFVTASLMLLAAIGFSLKGNLQMKETQIKNHPWGLIIVEQGRGVDANKTFLKIANYTGEGICVHANVYENGDWNPVYGYVPAWANTREKATYIYWSHQNFSLKQVADDDYHTDNICTKSKVSQF